MLKGEIPLNLTDIPELLMSLQSQYPDGKINVRTDCVSIGRTAGFMCE